MSGNFTNPPKPPKAQDPIPGDWSADGTPDPIQEGNTSNPPLDVTSNPPPDPRPATTRFPAAQKADLSREKVDRTATDLQLLTSRVSQLEGGLKSALDGLKVEATRRENDYQDIIRLRVNLKLTIRAVERLAKGKSLGALGLPGEEEWKEAK